VNWPLHEYQIDIAAYTHSYNHDLFGCVDICHEFWGDPLIRTMLLKKRFEIHDHKHRLSCFKKDCECRFLFPFYPQEKTHIDEDESKGTIFWHQLVNTEELQTRPWILNTKRNMGCEYMNSHSWVISELLNCNSNVQIGDPTQVFYSTLYSSKSTQKEDAERHKRIARSIVYRLIRQENQVTMGVLDSFPSGFGEGISRMLSGIMAATSRDVVSAPMAHLIICNNGRRFTYSHDFAPLLLKQMDDVLHGNPINASLRTTTKNGETCHWEDVPSYDYIHRPKTPEFDNMSLYEFTSRFKRVFRSDKRTIYKNKFEFLTSHPSKDYCYLIEQSTEKIPKVFTEKDVFCSIDNLEMENQQQTISKHTVLCRENYARNALLLFYPYRNLQDLLTEGTFWKTFQSELLKNKQGVVTKLWEKGFQILQNRQDRVSLHASKERAADYITKQTTLSPHFPSTRKTHNKRSNLPDLTDLLTMT
jgi:hypothetical protein